ATLLSHAHPTLFPYTTLFRSIHGSFLKNGIVGQSSIYIDLWQSIGTNFLYLVFAVFNVQTSFDRFVFILQSVIDRFGQSECVLRDRKSTRLNSSHVKNSYAVF